MPATASQMAELISKIEKLALEKDKTTNELSVQPASLYFSNKFGKENKGELLKVFVERANTTFNIYWKQLEDAAEYTVEIYKYVSMCWYKLTEKSVDRREGFAEITNLVGDGYVFRVVARNRAGEELAKSAGVIIGSKTAE
jgi:hypothetical protein